MNKVIIFEFKVYKEIVMQRQEKAIQFVTS